MICSGSGGPEAQQGTRRFDLRARSMPQHAGRDFMYSLSGVGRGLNPRTAI